MHRRVFVASVAAAALLPRRWPLRPDPLVAHVGLQLYTVRTLLAQDFEGTLARVAAVGYEEVEFAGYFGHAPAAVRGMLARAGLRAPAAHVDAAILTGDPARVFADAREAGHEFVVVPWIPEELRRSPDDWRRLAERLDAAGASARRAGLRLAYHNQAYDVTPIEGRVPLELLLEATDPRHVAFELDLYWFSRGGDVPQSLFARWPGRFPLVHAKDARADGTMTEVGSGVLDWRAILARRAEAGIAHVFVEHDEPADPMASITASYRFLHGPA